MIKAAQMLPIIMIALPTAQITIIITAAIWIALKQIITIAAKQLEAITGNTTMIAIIMNIDKRNGGGNGSVGLLSILLSLYAILTTSVI